MTCLETSFLIDLFRGKEKVNKLMDELNKHEEQLTVAAPTIMELWSGALLAIHSEREKAKIIQLEDIQIAAIAKAHGEQLITRDEHFARIPGLRVLKY